MPSDPTLKTYDPFRREKPTVAFECARLNPEASLKIKSHKTFQPKTKTVFAKFDKSTVSSPSSRGKK